MNEPLRVIGDHACDRCGEPVNMHWVDITQLGDVRPRVGFVRATCPTSGCVDEDGSNEVFLEYPGGLTRDDQRWLLEQRRLIREYGEVARALHDATKGW